MYGLNTFSLQKELTETEDRVALQRGRNKAIDMRERLEDIKRRQQAIREQIGEVAEKRRIIEPVFEELKDRQRQFARMLDKLEADDDKNNVADRVTELERNMTLLQARQNALYDSFAKLNRLKEETDKLNASLMPLHAPETGIRALIAELHSRRDPL